MPNMSSHKIILIWKMYGSGFGLVRMCDLLSLILIFVSIVLHWAEQNNLGSPTVRLWTCACFVTLIHEVFVCELIGFWSLLTSNSLRMHRKVCVWLTLVLFVWNFTTIWFSVGFRHLFAQQHWIYLYSVNDCSFSRVPCNNSINCGCVFGIFFICFFWESSHPAWQNQLWLK